MGRFIGHLPDESIAAALRVTDDRALLQTGFVLEQKPRLGKVSELLGPERLDGLIGVASTYDLWPEALDLLAHLDAERQRQLVERAVERDDVLESLVQAAERHGIWDDVLRLQSVTSEPSQERFVRFVEEHHPKFRRRLERSR